LKGIKASLDLTASINAGRATISEPLWDYGLQLARRHLLGRKETDIEEEEDGARGQRKRKLIENFKTTIATLELSFLPTVDIKGGATSSQVAATLNAADLKGRYASIHESAFIVSFLPS
jgi:hypothetical protein